MSIEQCGTSNSSGELVKRRSKPWGEVEEKTLIKKFFKGKFFIWNHEGLRNKDLPSTANGRVTRR